MALNAGKLGLSGGIMWGATMLVTTLISINTGYGTELLNVFASIYPGYSISPAGSIIGLIYGFIDAFILIYIFAQIYNRM